MTNPIRRARQRHRSWLLLCAAVLCVHMVAGRAWGQERQVPFQQFADSFRESHDLGEAAAAEVPLRDLLDQQYLSIRLGRLDLRCPPRWLTTKTARRRLVRVLVALLDLQQTWGEWFTGTSTPADHKKQLSTVRRWIQTWGDTRLRKAAEAGAGDLLEIMSPGTSQTEALAALRGRWATAAEQDPGASLIVLSPNRQHFLELCCFLGTIDEQNRAIFWQQNLSQRAQCWVPYPVAMQVVALEYAAPGQEGSDFTSGFDMDSREKTGLEQHVVQCAAASLTHDLLHGRIDISVELGLIDNLTIAVCGENNARFGGDGKGRSSAARGGFVMGGRSAGGGISMVSMDSRWRVTKGRRHFVKALARGQKNGGKRAAKGHWKPGCFQLQNQETTESFIVEAPFLGSPAEERPPLAEEFVDDFKEFHRAYRSGFAHWLRTAAAGGAAPSRTALGKLLRQRADPDAKQKSFDECCHEIYGVPLSNTGPEPASLESRFLEWLRRQ